MSRIFTDQELKEFSKSLPQQALEALKAGNLGKLSHTLLQMSGAHTALHFLGIATITRIWGKWQHDQGETKTLAMLDRIGRRVMEPFIKQFKDGKEKETIADIINIYTHHAGAQIVPVAQEDDELVFDLAPCGSGGMNVLKGFEKKMPQWYTRCTDGTPIFCAACKSLQKALNKACGETVWSTEINKSVPGSCLMKFRQVKTAGETLFDANELYEVTKTRSARAMEKVAVGNLAIQDLIVDQQKDWGPWHDLMIVWNEYTFAASREIGGMDYLEECLKEGYDSGFSFLYASMESFKTDAERVSALAQNWHYHQGKFRIEEEDDRFVFILDPCGSGGRLLREEMNKDMFHYGTELAPMIKEKHNLTFQRENFPLYCVHCASGNRDQFRGNPLIFVVDGHAQMRRGMPCRQYVWKKGVNTKPETALLEQVGMTDDEWGEK